jgi:ornithine decarboxylase
MLVAEPADTCERLFPPETLDLSRLGTPFFLIELTRILANLHSFEENFPASSIYYAMKANSEPAILEALHLAGAGFEIASVFELRLLRDLGVEPERIIYGTAIKPDWHIREAFRYGVGTFAVDSFQEIEKVAVQAPGSEVYVRASVDDAGSVFRFSEKFGANLSEIIPLLLRSREVGLQPAGISFHVGSQAGYTGAWARSIERLQPLLGELQAMGMPIRILNLGGDTPIDTFLVRMHRPSRTLPPRRCAPSINFRIARTSYSNPDGPLWLTHAPS